jgi:hypothetical protein
MSLITGYLNQITTTPSSQQLTVKSVVFPVIVGNALIVPDQVTLKADEVGFWSVVLTEGLYELTAVALNGQEAKVTISVPNDSNTYSFDELVVSDLPIPSSPIGGAQPTASPSVLGIIKTDDAVAQPVAITGWFYKLDAATARSSLASLTNNKVLIVKSTGNVYGWDASSTAVDDGTDTSTAIRLSDTSALSPGRFVLVVQGIGGAGVDPVIYGTGNPNGVVTPAAGKKFYWSTNLLSFHLYLGSGTNWQELTG